MNHYSLFVGIDVAMMKHDCCIMDKDSKILIKKFTFNNTLPGYQKFVDKLTTFSTDKSQIFIGLEVTGIYGDNLYERLKMDGFNIIMIRPDSVKKYRDYLGLPKTDKLDAKCITDILVRGEAKPVSSQKKEYAELKSLTRRKACLKKTLTQEKNRFLARINVYFPDLLNVFKTGFATMKAIFSSYSTPYSIINADQEKLLNLIKLASKNRYGEEKMIELIEAARNSIAVRTLISEEEKFHILSLMDSVHYLETQIHELDHLIDTKALDFPAYRILLSFTGCGKSTAATIIAELGDLSRFHKASQIVSFAGLFGYNSESGNSVNKRGKLSKKGSRELRHALYMVAEFARRNNPVLKDYFIRKKNGDRKKHTLAVNAVANKLCAILFSIMRNDSIYVIKYRDLAKLPEVTQNEFFHNAETDFLATTRKKKYLFEDVLGVVHEFVYRSTSKLSIE
ncbi:IS110 family transposase [Anaerorhabdus sp.]|uniref:IS110 family transposase n=1 Tax=Anaerorhabdus sp. TaxID=1872524 RepID=UPI002FC5BEE1